MKLKKGSFSDFAERVKAVKKKVIVYGAGTIGQAVAPYWLNKYQLDTDVLCYADADKSKHGQVIQLAECTVPVVAPDTLEKYRGTYTLLITVSAFEPVVRELEEIPGTEDAEAYFLPIMLLDIAHTPKKGGVIKTSDRQLIPQKIHYCWFSGNPIPDRLTKCMDSWKRFCPDYEIVRWDESNYDVSQNRYMQQAYENKKWGFIPDIARLDILHRHGGIYLDTDVELICNLDELLYQPGFCGVEKWGTVNFGGCSGSQPGNPVVKMILDFRKVFPFVGDEKQLNLTTCGYYETIPLIQQGMQVNGETQVLADGKLTVYSSDYFHPFDYMSGETRITENTFSIHHFSGTWLGANAAKARSETKRRYQEFLSKLEG